MSTLKQLSFAGGEIAPSLYARNDIVKYSTGLRTCRNFFIMKHGGAANRPGTIFTVETKDSSKTFKQIPFIFNAEQTYDMEFGDQYIRFIRDGAQIEVDGVAAWDQSTQYVIGDLVSLSGVNYYAIADSLNQTPPNSTYWYALTGNTYEIPSPYLEADLPLLKYDQSSDIVTLTHQDYPPMELLRFGHTRWILRILLTEPAIDAPTNLAVDGGAGNTAEWVVTAVDEETGEESLPTASVGGSSDGSSGSPRVLTWIKVDSAISYNVYKKLNGIFGFIGIAGQSDNPTFSDEGITPDTTETPPSERNPFEGEGNYPAVCGYFQQRHLFGGSRNKIKTIEGSRSANIRNFTKSFPRQEDDALTFNVPGRQDAIKAIIDLGNLIVMTAGSEWLVQGDSAGILLPGETNPKQQSYNGCSDIMPLLINNNALYVQARGSIIRDLFSSLDAEGNTGYKGDDLTVFATHLFQKYTIVDWAYQQNRNSIVWVVRSDGVLLGLTYLREHQIWAWHRHDTDGVIENVCVVPEGNTDVLYIGVKRIIDGQTKRYIERMADRQINDIVDYVGMDSSLKYDGRNTDDTRTMTLSGSGWTHDDTLTLTCNQSFFDSGDIDNEIHLIGSDETLIRAKIIGFTSATVVSVKPQKDVPVSMQNVAISNWGKAVDRIDGLDHLEGKDLSIFGDGFVVASPYNPEYAKKTVDSGGCTLDKCYVVIIAGLPFLSDLQTLNVDTNSGETISDKKMIVNEVSVSLEESRGFWVGTKPPADDTVDATQGLSEKKIRNQESLDEPISLTTDTLNVKTNATWNNNGRVFVRQIDPIPLTVLAIMPAGLFPIRG